jgi:hypothetical protein
VLVHKGPATQFQQSNKKHGNIFIHFCETIRIATIKAVHFLVGDVSFRHSSSLEFEKRLITVSGDADIPTSMPKLVGNLGSIQSNFRETKYSMIPDIPMYL